MQGILNIMLMKKLNFVNIIIDTIEQCTDKNNLDFVLNINFLK